MIFCRRKPDENYCYRKPERRHRQNDYRVQLVLSDCGYIKLLNQAPDDANDIARLLHISDEEKRYIENAEVGSGLLIADKVVVPFNNTFPQDTELFRLMDTNPNRKK